MIHLGDVFDAQAGGPPNRFFDKDRSLLSEYRAAVKVLTAYREAATTGRSRAGRRKAKCYWLEGNHEARVRTADRMPKSLLGLLDYRTQGELGREWRRWQWRPYISPHKGLPDDLQGMVRFGQVTLIHGWKFGGNSDRDEAQTYGVEYGLTVRAHTHRPIGVTRGMVTTTVAMNRWYANVGWGGDLSKFKMGYAGRRDTTLWGSAILVFACDPTVVAANERKWSAELIEV